MRQCGRGGKATVAFCLATALARRLPLARAGLPECRAACTDADPNRTLQQAHRMSAVPGIRCAGSGGGTLLPAVRDAQVTAGLVVIDLEGPANQAMPYACGKADLVLVPAQPSRFDVVEAVKASGVVRQAADRVGRGMAHRAPLARTPVLRQKVAGHSRGQFVKAGLPQLRAELAQRTAFQHMTCTGEPPPAQDPEGGAARNVKALADEMAGLLGWGRQKRQACRRPGPGRRGEAGPPPPAGPQPDAQAPCGSPARHRQRGVQTTP